jgi:hypothetical protein
MKRWPHSGGYSLACLELKNVVQHGTKYWPLHSYDGCKGRKANAQNNYEIILTEVIKQPPRYSDHVEPA